MKPISALSAVIAIFITQNAFAQDWGAVSIRDVGRDQEGYNWIAIEVNLHDGWKTYWKHAGQNGLDPIIELSQGEETIETEIIWPKPKLFLADNLPAVGYKGSTLIPVKFKGDGEMRVNVDIGVCETVCVPTQTEYEFTAQPGYSIEQYILQGTPSVEKVDYCQYDETTLNSLDETKHWLFVDVKESVITNSQEELEKIIAEKGNENMTIYAVDEDGVEPIPCS